MAKISNDKGGLDQLDLLWADTRRAARDDHDNVFEAEVVKGDDGSRTFAVVVSPRSPAVSLQDEDEPAAPAEKPEPGDTQQE